MGATARVAQDPMAAERREVILDQAAELFSERGYHATSMRDIAEAIGIRAPSLYAHIQGKEDLLYGIVTGAAAQFLSSLEAVRASSASPPRKLRDAMRAHVRVVADNLQGARVFHHEWRALSEPRRTEVRALRDRYEGLWEEVIGGLRPDDPGFARLLALSAANWTYVWYRPDGALSPAEVSDRFTDLLLRGLGRRRSGKIRGG